MQRQGLACGGVIETRLGMPGAKLVAISQEGRRT